jgi:hypothetical protein
MPRPRAPQTGLTKRDRAYLRGYVADHTFGTFS